MNLTTTKEQFLPLLLKALSAADTHKSLPILSHLLIECEGGSLSVTGSDLQTQIIARGQIGGADSGGIAVPGRKLVDIVRLLPDRADITLKLSGERLTIQSGRGRFTLATLPAANFPEFERHQPHAAIELPAPTLLRALSSVRFAAGVNDVRYYLNGVALEIGTEVLRTIASDGHRLTLSELPCAAGDPVPLSIIPIKAADELIRLLKGYEGSVSLVLSRAAVTVQLGETAFSAKLIEGAYPDYRRVIPKDGRFRFSAATAELADALRRVMILAGQEYSGVALAAGADTIKLQSRNAETEEANEEIAVESDAPEDAPLLGFNARYLIDALNVVESDRVEVTIGGNGSAVIAEPDSAQWTAIVMPMRL